jgi:putative peptidoglycan lipid II flippase
VRGDHRALAGTVGQALELVALLCLPAAAALAVFGVPVIGLVYEHGRFTAADTTAAAHALAGYAVGLAGYAGIKVLAPTFYALGDARTPAVVSLVSIAVNYALNWTFVRTLGFGHVGLALATSAVALGNFAFLYVLLRRRLGRLGSHAGGRLARIVVLTVLMIGAAAAVDALVAAALPVAPLARHAARLAVATPVALLVFWGAGGLLGVGVPRLGRRPAGPAG